MKKLIALLFFFNLQFYAFADGLINDWNSVSKSKNVSCKSLILLKDSGKYDEKSSDKKQLELVNNCVEAVLKERGY